MCPVKLLRLAGLFFITLFTLLHKGINMSAEKQKALTLFADVVDNMSMIILSAQISAKLPKKLINEKNGFNNILEKLFNHMKKHKIDLDIITHSLLPFLILRKNEFPFLNETLDKYEEALNEL